MTTLQRGGSHLNRVRSRGAASLRKHVGRAMEAGGKKAIARMRSGEGAAREAAKEATRKAGARAVGAAGKLVDGFSSLIGIKDDAAAAATPRRP